MKKISSPTFTGWFALILLLALLPAAHAEDVATDPVGDLLSGAIKLIGDSSPSSARTGTITGATREPGEPLHAGIAGLSVWYDWTPSQDGVATFTTVNTPDIATFDTILAVYTGKTVANLQVVTENDNDPDALNGDVTSKVIFLAKKGTTYHLAVASKTEDPGQFGLTWSLAAGAGLVRFVSAEYFVNEETDADATIGSEAQITLQRFGPMTSEATVLFSTEDIATENGADADVDYESVPPTSIKFLAGEATAVAKVKIIHDEDLEGDQVLRLILTTNDQNKLRVGLENQAILTIRDNEDDPENDALANALALTPPSGSIDGDNTGAGVETNEPAHAGVANGHSIWYKFTAPGTGVLLLDTAGSIDATDPNLPALDTVLAVYTSTQPSPTVAALTPVASNDNAPGQAAISRLIFTVSAKTYYIAIDTKQQPGQIKLNWSFGTGGIVQFSQPAYSVDEDAGTATITVTRVGGLENAIDVGYQTEDDTATSPDDYQAVPAGLLRFAAGEAVKTFPIAIFNDSLTEGSESLDLHLTSANGGAVIAGLADAVLTIDDDEDNPPNDFFANAQVVSGSASPAEGVPGDNTGARREPGEPIHGGPGSDSIWFKWRAPASGVVTFNTADSTDANGDELDTLLAAYTGDSLATLVQVAANDNTDLSRTSAVSFGVRGGTTYYLAVDGRDGAQGPILLNWQFGAGGLLQFSQARYEVNELGSPTALITVNRTDGASGPVSVTCSIVGGTAKPFDATTGGDYDPPSTDPLTFGNGVTTATVRIPIRDDDQIEGDETILLSLSAPTGGALLGDLTSATLVINDNEDDPPNDNFLSSQGTIAGPTGTVTGLNAGASRQPGEPLHAGVAGHRSIWYKWTAAASGVAAFETTGSVRAGGGPLDTLLAVYTGTTFANLVSVAANNDAAPGIVTSRVTFAATSGKTYLIAVDSTGDVGGEVNLSWSLGAGGLLQFRQPTFYARERDGAATIVVDRVGSTTGAVTVNYAATAIPGSATGGPDIVNSDFKTVSGTLTILAKQTSKAFSVSLRSGDGKDGDQSFLVTLSAPGGSAVLISDTVSATVLIDDSDDDPVNDDFASSSQLTGASGTVTGTNAGASLEPGEPTATAPGRRTIWYRWTPPTSGIATLDTLGSGAFDTVLTVFTGTSLGTLQTVVTSDSTALGDRTSRVSFAAVGGTIYQIAVDARAPIIGPTFLNWALATGGTFSLSAATYLVDEKPGPPAQYAIVTINRTGSNANAASVDFDTADGTAVAGGRYVGIPLTTLRFAPGQTTATIGVKINDDALSNGDQTFFVRLRGTSFGASLGAITTARITIRDDDSSPPGDHFAVPTTIATDIGAGSGSFTATNVGAGRDPNERLPGLLGRIGSGRTVWFKWQAPATGNFTFDTIGSLDGNGAPLDTLLGIYSGAAVNGLVTIAENDDDPANPPASAVTLRANSGRVYYLAVDTVGDATGDIALNWQFSPLDGLGPLLQPGAGATAAASFTEKYSETAADPTGNFSFTIVAPLTDRVDIAGLSKDTAVQVVFGNFSHTDTLGGVAGSFDPKKTSVTYPLTGGTITYAWTAKALTITGKGSSPNDFNIVAPTLTGSNPGNVPGYLDITIAFAGAQGGRRVYYNGTHTVSSAGLNTISITNGAADYAPPTLTFGASASPNINPANNARVTVDTVTFTGKITDGVSIHNDSIPLGANGPLWTPLRYSINGGDLIDLPPTGYVQLHPASGDVDDPKNALWQLDDAALQPGPNTFVFLVTDDSGNTATSTRVINRVTNSPLTILTDGQGTVTGATNGQSLEIGKSVTLTAKPAAGWLFKEWTGGAASLNPTITFLHQDGLSITARFVRNPFLTLTGGYSGLAQPGNFNLESFAPGQVSRFTLNITSSATGLFTGNVLGVGFGGTFNTAGDATVIIPRGTLPSYTVTLHLDVKGTTEQVTGSVTNGTFTSSIVADHNVFNATNLAPPRGTYTVILPSTALLNAADPPAGHGFMTAIVQKDGSVNLTVKVADGTGSNTFTYGNALSKNGVLGIYQVLQPGNVVVAGTAAFTGNPYRVSGALHWYRPGVGTLDLDVQGEPFAKLAGRVLPGLDAAGVNGKITAYVAGAGYNGAPLQQQVTLPPASATATNVNFVVPAATTGNPPVTTGLNVLSVNPTNGLLSGKVRDPRDAKTLVTCSGIVLQSSNLGAGFFLVGTKSGYVVLQNPPPSN